MCRCPLTAPLTFIPPPLPHCPSRPACRPPIGLRGGGGTAGLHQRPGAVRGSGPDAGTQQSLKQERDREGAETDSFKKAVQTHPFSEKGISRTKQFILLPKPALCQPRIQQPRRDSFPPLLAFLAPPRLLLSAPTANGPLECVNKRDNLIKKIQSSSLGNKVRFEWVQYVPPLFLTPPISNYNFISNISKKC